MASVLVIDDEAGIRSVLRDVLQDENYKVFLAEDGLAGLELLEQESIDLVILDVWMPNMGGIDVLKRIKDTYTNVEVIIISGHANINLAVSAVKIGAFDFLEKPLSLEKTLSVVQKALKYEKMRIEHHSQRGPLFTEDTMIGSSPAFKKIRDIIEYSAPTDSRILILGENGTGKELIAREIHKKSKRADGPFVEVNCAAIPETLIESELFGHEKGSFTNALNRRKGKFELADNGTIFLDEIADMSLSTQAKVLRAIQESKFERIGGEGSIEVNIRIIAATNKDIQEEIAAKRFREDLYFRLNVVPIYVPSLRERHQDIVDLLDYYMEKYKHQSRLTKNTFMDDALAYLLNYSWPGNIRELKNFTERINIMVDHDVISKDIVCQYLGESKIFEASDNMEEYDKMKLNEARQEFEKKLILKKLEETNYNITKTAQLLGIYPSNLHSKLKKYGIEIKK